MGTRKQIEFDDGAAYEGFMGAWSRLAGDAFLDWLAPDSGWRWTDIGCGNGAFTQLLLERCDPARIHGIDPSQAQVAYARHRLDDGRVELAVGDAMALPYADGTFDAATMALVLFFVSDPARGVAEMARVVRPGGSVSAYVWDILEGGFPFAAMQQAFESLGIAPVWPPSVEVSRRAALQALWIDCGLVDVDTSEIAVQRTFPDFEAFWDIARTGPRVESRLGRMTPSDVQTLRARLQARLPVDAEGRVTCHARANAVAGRVPTR